MAIQARFAGHQTSEILFCYNFLGASLESWRRLLCLLHTVLGCVGLSVPAGGVRITAWGERGEEREPGAESLSLFGPQVHL